MSSQIEETVVNVEEPVITAPTTPDKQHRKRHTSSTSGKKEKKEKKSEKNEKTEKKEKNNGKKEKSDKKEKDENGAKRRRRNSKGQPSTLASLATDGIEEAALIAEQPAVHVPDTPVVAEQPAEGHTGAAESDTGAAEPPKKLAKIPVPTPSELAAQTASAVRPAESDDASIAGGDNGVAEPPTEPDLALVTVEGKASGAKNPIGVAGYKIDDETKSLVLAAECITDVPTKARNRLYAAMGRVFDAAANGRNPLNIQPAVVARYVDEKGSQATSFKMLKEFVADTSCATMTLMRSRCYHMSDTWLSNMSD